MKIYMHLFCLIGALVTSITDGRLSSSLSSLSSSSSQPVGGSVMEVTPDQRELEPLAPDAAAAACIDSEKDLYKGRTCDWISAINNKKRMKNKCNKTTEHGKIYELCPSTCSGVDLGRCTTSKLEEIIISLRANITDLEVPITDEDVILNSVIFKDMKAEKEALEAALAGCKRSDPPTLQPSVNPSVLPSSLPSIDSNCTAVIAEKIVLEVELKSLERYIESLLTNITNLETILASSTSPSTSPTKSPSDGSSSDPSSNPSSGPSFSPSVQPTKPPTTSPTNSPTTKPPTTKPPTKSPTTSPTKSPTYALTTKTCFPGFTTYLGQCYQCPLGTSGTDGVTCDPCLAGTYTAFLGQTECTPCPVDTFSNKVGSTSIYNCKNCPQGKTTTDTTGATTEDQCTDCPVNTYGLPVDINSGTAGCRSCTKYPVNTNYGPTTCGRTGAKSYLGCAFGTPENKNPNCTKKEGESKFYGSINGGARSTYRCSTQQSCFPNAGDERPNAKPLDEYYYGTASPTNSPTMSPPTTLPSDLPSAKPSIDVREDCTLCTSRPVITESGNEFRTKVSDCLSGNCRIGCWDTSEVTDMSFAFVNKKSFNDSINCWDVASVTDMNFMFVGATNFNQPLDDWDVGSVTNMENMFREATNFNQPLDDWDVGSVTDMSRMFETASNFNQSLDDWNVASVSDMGSMFQQATKFNQPLDDWDVASVTDMNNMFILAAYFNQPLDAWNVARVTDMRYMFYGAPKFNQCLSSWADKTTKTLPDVTVVNIFGSSGCPYSGILNPLVGPWCQGDNDLCFV